MCGIVGVVHRDPERPVDPALIRVMCDAIRHRGPDDEGVWVDGSVGLGMRRLSIIDLAGGRQPIFNEDGTRVIVFNGEIYNYRELRSGLLARGHRLATSGDTETIVHLHEERGANAVHELRGMFALAVWDTRARTLLLARDRFGIKPLYYVEKDWGIAFASELKALVAAGLTDRGLGFDALDAYLQLGYIPAPFTPFRDVRKLEPGQLLEWHDGVAVARRYWDLPQEVGAPPPNVEECVREWIDDSVRAHLVADVPVAAFLSGGLDSSAVVASMALQSDRPPHAFTARYLGSGAPDADETGLARTLADRFGARLTVVDIEPHIQDSFESMVGALEEPHADDSILPTWELSRAVGRSYKVALTGIGGDELFAGYRRHYGLRVAEQFARLPHLARRLASRAAWLLGDGRSLGVDRLKRFTSAAAAGGGVPDLYVGMLSRLGEQERATLWSPSLRASTSGALAARWFRTLYGRRRAMHGADAAMYLDYHTFLADDILALSDRLSMAHGLEVRVPFVDHVLVERIFPLPWSLKVGMGAPKRLLRASLASRVPTAHLSAPKRGFVGPTAAWLRNELRPMLADELSPSRMRRLGYFDPGIVDRLVSEHFGGRHNREGILWALLAFSTWHRIYMEGTARAGTHPAASRRAGGPADTAPVAV